MVNSASGHEGGVSGASIPSSMQFGGRDSIVCRAFESSSYLVLIKKEKAIDG